MPPRSPRFASPSTLDASQAYLDSFQMMRSRR
jgi:hypothetical protein